MAGAAALVLVGATANPSTPRPVLAAPTAAPAPPEQMLPRLLYDRAEHVMGPAATRSRPIAHRAAPKRVIAHQAVRHRSRTVRHHTVRHHTVRHRVERATLPHSVAASGSAYAVIAYARAQLGDPYAHGAAGPSAFDCSGLVMMAYRRIGIGLPHSAAAIADRAHSVSRSSARPGDIVVGSGHVGIYMGGGMMIDAGNPRVGVSYRRMYSGLWIERL
jgi:peptidoglycan DL-endopeptidase CwlO